MQPTGITNALGRLLVAGAPDLLADLFTPGRILEADVVSVFEGRAVLAFGRGVRQEVVLQTPLQEGQRVRVQVQPREGAMPAQTTAQPGTPAASAPAAQQGPAIVLKVLGTVEPQAEATVPREGGDGAVARNSTGTGQTSAAPRLAAAALREAASAPAAQQTGAPPAPAPAPGQPGAPQIVWLPIPLPDGNQGWAQLHVQEDDSPATRARRGGPVHQVRIWWETPGLGPVQVAMESSSAGGLSTLFTAALAEIRQSMEAALPDLQERLAAAGFGQARLGCRAPAPGEAVEPARLSGASRLDRRM